MNACFLLGMVWWFAGLWSGQFSRHLRSTKVCSLSFPIFLFTATDSMRSDSITITHNTSLCRTQSLSLQLSFSLYLVLVLVHSLALLHTRVLSALTPAPVARQCCMPRCCCGCSRALPGSEASWLRTPGACAGSPAYPSPLSPPTLLSSRSSQPCSSPMLPTTAPPLAFLV